MDGQSNNPKRLYHYTSLDSLALILQNRTIKFNSLQNVDDLEEAATKDMGNFGKYIYASCWTDSDRESIALWKLYTPDMHGVRITLPAFPFKKYRYKAGQYNLPNDITTYINLERLYEDNHGSIDYRNPELEKIRYCDDESILFPKVRCTSKEIIDKFLGAGSMEEAKGCEIEYSYPTLGRYKRTDWSFQREWRYLMFIIPIGIKDIHINSLQKQQEQIRIIENSETPLPYECFFLKLDDDAVQEMKIMAGPRMTEAEKIYLKSLLRDHGLLGNYSESQLHIR